MITINTVIAADSQPVASYGGVISEKTEGWKFAVSDGAWGFTFNPLEGWYPDKGGKLISPRIKLPKAADGQEYYRITFDGSAKERAFEAIAFYDKDGNMLADNYDVVYPGEMRHYDRVVFAHEGTVEAEIFFQSKKGYEIHDLKLEKATVEDAAKYCDDVAAKLPNFKPVAEHGDMFKGAPKTLDALRKGDREVRILFLGDSIIQDTFHSQVHALFQREFPKAKAKWLLSVRGGTGCWFYRIGTNYTEYVTAKKPDCVILGGISNWKAVRPEYPVSGNAAYLEVVAKILKDGIELICLAPGLSVDTRMKEWSKEYSPLPSMAFDDSKIAQAFSLTIDKDKPKDPSGLDAKGLEELKAECEKRGVGFLDIFTPAYQWLYESGLPWSWYSRDYCHSGELGKQVIARTIEAYIHAAQ